MRYQARGLKVKVLSKLTHVAIVSINHTLTRVHGPRIEAAGRHPLSNLLRDVPMSDSRETLTSLKLCNQRR